MDKDVKKESEPESKKDDFLDELDPYLKKRFESELASVFEELEEDQDLGKAVDEVFEQTSNLYEIQSKLILIIKGCLNDSKENDPELQEAIDADEAEIAKDIIELTRKLMKDINPEMENEFGRISHKDRAYMLDAKAKQNFKKIMKNFAVYEVYKVMNPNRIAGETAKENYRHNLSRGGQKLASKYEGGKASDLKEYGKAEVKNIKSQARAIKNSGFGRGR